MTWRQEATFLFLAYATLSYHLKTRRRFPISRNPVLFLGFWVPCFKHWNVLSQDLEIRLFWPCFKETYFNSGTYSCHPRMKSFVKRNSKSSVTSVVYYCLQKNCYPPRNLFFPLSAYSIYCFFKASWIKVVEKSLAFSSDVQVTRQFLIHSCLYQQSMKL